MVTAPLALGVQHVLTPQTLARPLGWVLPGERAGSTDQTGPRTCLRCAVSRRASMRPRACQHGTHSTTGAWGVEGRGEPEPPWGPTHHTASLSCHLGTRLTTREPLGPARPAASQGSCQASQLCARMLMAGPPLPICLHSQVAPIFRAKALQPGCKQGSGAVEWARFGEPATVEQARAAWPKGQQAGEDGPLGWG